MQSTDLSTLFSALADPTRRAIVARLSSGDAAVKELAEPFSLSGPAITKHLQVLERAGIISRGREGKLRPCHLEPRALAPAAEWIEQYRSMWEAQLDRLGELLKASASKKSDDGARTKPPAHRLHQPSTTTKTKRGQRNGRTR